MEPFCTTSAYEFNQVVVEEVSLAFPVLTLCRADTWFNEVKLLLAIEGWGMRDKLFLPVFPFWKKVPENMLGLPENSFLEKASLISG